MQFSGLVEARLLRRYKRFLADVRLADGEELTVHCPNTGAMTGCVEEGAAVWLSTSDSARRKYAHTWEVAATRTGTVCIHSARANAVVREALAADMLPGLADYAHCRSEVVVVPGTRADMVLEGDAGRVVVEVKSVTLCRDGGWGAFPDAVSSRGRKHVLALQDVLGPRTRSLLVFCAMHTGIHRVCVAGDIDPAYRAALEEAMRAGVEVVALGCDVSPTAVAVRELLPFSLDSAA
ncbi:sugar fermentation stimulation protein A [Chromatocurvus halotolerans]|uniref:Sugar fermentation stimulation protein homolog n=2 Tax=Chromatocurvus halotolerans TaxID=1132028 RepID=A0A4V2SBD6_9GAMM|nr:sugar fermentation stimulation protein A [Chromatocurvus halotolerans]